MMYKVYNFSLGRSGNKMAGIVANTILEAKEIVSKKYPDIKATFFSINIKYNSYEKRIN